MKLFVVHVGFYDKEIGIYELHTNFIVAANDVTEVKSIVKQREIFKNKKMHIDAVQEIEIVDGYRVTLTKDDTVLTESKDYSYSAMKAL